MATCWAVKTGDKLWEERLSGAGHHASAVYADGRVYFTADDGVTTVVRAAAEYEVLAKNALGEKVFASPAFSDGDVFLRGEKHVFRVTGSEPRRGGSQ